MSGFRHLTVVLFMMCATVACGQRTDSALKGQKNATVTVYGFAVDQDGNPLAGARFQFRLEAYPKDWTFDKRGRDKDVSLTNAVSDIQGRFQLNVTGSDLIRMKAEREGYRHFCETDVGRSEPGDNFAFSLMSWSDLCYRSDPALPAVFVFVKDGVREISALPCMGGYSSGNGIYWTRNQPGWPRKASLNDVVYKGDKPTPYRAVVSKPLTDDPHASEIAFYGLAVDQTGKPLQGAGYGVIVEQAPPRTWNAQPGDKLKVVAEAHVKSGPDGRFEVLATGRSIRIESNWAKYRPAGYNPLYEEDLRLPAMSQNIWYSLDPTSPNRYRSDPDRPAVFVYVARGVREVSVLPSRGGYDTSDGKTWATTSPMWPKLPSVGGVAFVQPSTKPTKQ